MIIQAGTFMIPYKLWSYWEGGLLEQFDREVKHKIIKLKDADGNIGWAKSRHAPAKG